MRLFTALFWIFFLFSCQGAPRTKTVGTDLVMESITSDDTLTWSNPHFKERAQERHLMVERHIQGAPFYPIRDQKVLDAMKAVPRHKFIPESYQRQAYGNHPLPIGYGQTISQPFIVASMTELLSISPGDKILEIGTGSGYQAAVLSELTPHVYTVEIVEELGIQAMRRFQVLGYESIQVKIGDGYEGWREHAPFDRIIVTCAPEDIPEPLIDQLKPGGRIVIPVGAEGRTQSLVLVVKSASGKLNTAVQYPVIFVPMTGKARERKTP